MGVWFLPQLYAHFFIFMTPEAILDLYRKSKSTQEKNVLANQLVLMILTKPVTKNWNFAIIHDEKEMWKDIPNFEGKYQISSYGRIKKIKHGKCKISYYRSKSARNYPHTRLGTNN